MISIGVFPTMSKGVADYGKPVSLLHCDRKVPSKFDQGLLKAMTACTAFHKEVYQDGALSLKTKRLIALAAGLQADRTRCIQGQTKDAIAAGASKNEVLEAVLVTIVTDGTAGSAETWRVAKVLEELGQ